MTTNYLGLLPEAYAKTRRELLAERTVAGYWEGCLSSSALSTATAISALALHCAARDPTGIAVRRRLIERGLDWLAQQQNADGGWGDTDCSYSNIATTMLVHAAVVLAGRAEQWSARLERADRYIAQHGAVDGLRRRYGRDKTFAVPILTNAALADLIDWHEVAPLPFEAAWVPQRFYRWLRLPVVSYAIPALVAIGQGRFHHAPPRCWLLRQLRRAAIRPTLHVLQRIQPASGGYLEAVPLTSFVVMSLVSTGQTRHPVVQAGIQFLIDSVRPDGSWPIDTNLATWNTTLALNAFATAGEDVVGMASLDWLLDCQNTQRHPYTGAAPGGWGWTNLSGAVPDADDTAGALLAVSHWYRSASASDAARRRIERAASQGVTWLLDLQNRDGGWPTFCRGWGTLPFDRSGSDLTAHAMRALDAWRQLQPRRIAKALTRGWKFLQNSQRPDGSWIPLWFGDQDDPSEENPVYGTARVLLAFTEVNGGPDDALARGVNWLIAAQQPAGHWARPECVTGGVEQTALALETLTTCLDYPRCDSVALRTALQKGFSWLIQAVLEDRHRLASPIGFYFAKLWYYEKLYPRTFTTAALGRAVCRGEGLTADL